MRKSHCSIPLLVVLVSVSCSDSPPELTADTACEAYATAYVNSLELCSNGYYVREFSLDGTKTWTIERMKQRCIMQVKATGSNTTPKWWKTCAAAVAKSVCDDWSDGLVPEACKTPDGKLEFGASCVFDDQCKSLNCKIGNTESCGTCAEKLVTIAAGKACDPELDYCEGGYHCGAINNVCLAYRYEGEICDYDDYWCGFNYSCVSGSGAKRCQAQRTNAGESCGGTDKPDCNFTARLFCTSSDKCESATPRTPGQSCDGNYVCTLGSWCGRASTGAPKTCIAMPDVGEACDESGCQLYAYCINGVCQLRDPESC